MTTEWGDKLQLENCERSTQDSVVKGEKLTTYQWSLPGPTQPKALVLLLHGFRSYSLYNFLRYDDGLLKYGDSNASSFVRELNQRGFHVEAHDHVGHGRSTGLRAYFPSFQALEQDSVIHARRMRADFPGVPLFLIGHSLGGSLAILVARNNPQLIDGMCLSSAACEPPADMLGTKGTILASLSSIIANVVPKMEVIDLPKDDLHPEQQAAFEADPLNSANVQCRARPGREFLRAYSDIAKHLANLKTPVLAASGEHDTLVNPEASKRFIDGISSEDKTHYVAHGRWHNLFVEGEKEQIWALFADWIAARCK